MSTVQEEVDVTTDPTRRRSLQRAAGGLTAVLCAWLALPGAAAAPALPGTAQIVELTWKLAAGTDLVYRQSVESEAELPQGMGTSTTNMETTQRWNVLEVDGAGDATIRFDAGRGLLLGTEATMTLQTWLIAWAAAVGVVAAGQPGTPLSAADGRELETALSRILLNAATDHTAAEPRRVVISERAVNAYFRFQGADLLPPGIVDPEVSMPGAGRLRARATVDLDGMRDQQARGALDPLRYLSGSVPVTVVGVVHAADRTIRVEVESVEVGGVTVPPALFYELVRYHTRSERQPDGVDLTGSFVLPYSIDAVRMERQRTVVVQ